MWWLRACPRQAHTHSQAIGERCGGHRDARVSWRESIKFRNVRVICKIHHMLVGILMPKRARHANAITLHAQPRVFGGDAGLRSTEERARPRGTRIATSPLVPPLHGASLSRTPNSAEVNKKQQQQKKHVRVRATLHLHTCFRFRFLWTPATNAAEHPRHNNKRYCLR